MEKERIIEGEVGIAVIPAPIPADPPAPPAEDQKGTPPEGEAPPEVAAETTEQQQAKQRSKFQRRLDRQKSARVAAETEARLLREQLAKLEGQSTPKQQDSAEPKREAFESYEDYLRAVAKYDAEQATDKRIKADREAQGRAAETSKAEGEQKRLATEWNERERAFQSATKDYLEAVTPYLEEELGQLSEAARRAIVESEVGPQLLHHLATNPEAHESIAELSPLRQVAELGKLEINMKPAAKRTSSAPPPAKTVTPGRSAGQGYSDNMSDAEYREWRKSQGATWAR